MADKIIEQFSGLTIVMPNYNHAEYLQRALDSVVSQDCLPAEFIIVDDASTDNSWEILSEYKKTHQWIKVLRNEKNLGALASVHRLIEHVNTDYVWFFSADDMITQGAVLRAKSAAESYPEAGVIFGQMLCVDKADNLLNSFGSSRWTEAGYKTPSQFFNEFILSESPTHSLFLSTILRIEAWRDVGGFNEKLKSWSDTFAMWCCALKYGAYYTAAPAGCWRKLEGAYSSAQSSDLNAIVEMVEEAVSSMKSDQHRQLFPDEFVKKWAVEYMAVRYQQYTQKLNPSGQIVIKEHVDALKSFGSILLESRLPILIGQQPLVFLLNHFKDMLMKLK